MYFLPESSDTQASASFLIVNSLTSPVVEFVNLTPLCQGFLKSGSEIVSCLLFSLLLHTSGSESRSCSFLRYSSSSHLSLVFLPVFSLNFLLLLVAKILLLYSSVCHLSNPSSLNSFFFLENSLFLRVFVLPLDCLGSI